MAKNTLTVNVSITGLKGTLRAFRQLPKDANNELRDRSRELAQMLAQQVKAAGQTDSPQSALVAKTVRARRDRVPVVVAGGTRRVGRKRTPAGDLLFGSEFGMNRRTGWYAAPRYAGSSGRQYRPHRGRKGYWFFPTVDRNRRRIDRQWQKAGDRIVRKWGQGR